MLKLHVDIADLRTYVHETRQRTFLWVGTFAYILTHAVTEYFANSFQ